jgi:acetyltransferase-like isoleucine patch superfamily enzyme
MYGKSLTVIMLKNVSTCFGQRGRIGAVGHASTWTERGKVVKKKIGSFKSLLLKWLSIFLIPFPSMLKIPVYRCFFHYEIGKNVRIGLSWIKVEKLRIGHYVTIGHFNQLKNVPEIIMGDYSSIGHCNTFTSTIEFTNSLSKEQRGNQPNLFIGEHCGIAMCHFFDIQDTVIIGPYTTIAGNNSIFFTHYIDIINSVQSTRPIIIGHHCMIGSTVQFTPGAQVPDCCVVGMATVVTKKFTEPYSLIAGNPAKIIKKLPKEAAYFCRSKGHISSFTPAPYEIKN